MLSVYYQVISNHSYDDSDQLQQQILVIFVGLESDSYTGTKTVWRLEALNKAHCVRN